MDANFHGLLDLQSQQHQNGDPEEKGRRMSGGNAFSRMFILHSLGTLLVPGNSWKISMNYEKYLNEDFSMIGQLNWGKYVVDPLLMGLDEFQRKSLYPTGVFNFLVFNSILLWSCTASIWWSLMIFKLPSLTHVGTGTMGGVHVVGGKGLTVVVENESKDEEKKDELDGENEEDSDDDDDEDDEEKSDKNEEDDADKYDDDEDKDSDDDGV
ncbi:hypothetical protein LINPERPRIM_LOCUS20857 [Linum perenne]